ncbi:efflux RND transporter permease subunit, partial [Paraburkholderia sp. SIMBA_009]
ETMQSVREVESYIRRDEPAAYTFALGGFNLYGEGPNGGMIFVTLKNWKERKAARDHVQAIVARINERFAGTANTTVFAM